MKLTYPAVVLIVLVMAAVFVPGVGAQDGFREGFGIINPSFGVRLGFGETTVLTDKYDAVIGISPSGAVTVGFELFRRRRFSLGVNAFAGYSYDMYWLPEAAAGKPDAMMRAHTLRYGADVEMMAANLFRFGVGTELVRYLDGEVEYWFGTVPFDEEQKGHSIMVNAFAGVEPRLSDTWTLPIIARFQFDLGSIREGSLPLSPRLEVGLRWYPGGNLKENHDSQESENE